MSCRQQQTRRGKNVKNDQHPLGERFNDEREGGSGAVRFIKNQVAMNLLTCLASWSQEIHWMKSLIEYKTRVNYNYRNSLFQSPSHSEREREEGLSEKMLVRFLGIN